MPISNIVSTPNITGNVSSCKTELSIVKCASRDSLFYCSDKGYATNNCTGQTEVLNSWSLTGFSVVLMAFVGIIVFFVGIRIATD